MFLALYGSTLLLFCGYTLLDTFVLPKNVVYLSEVQTAQAGASTSESSGSDIQEETGSDESDETDSTSSSSTSDATITDTSYTSDDVSITITTKRVNDTTVYIADIQLSGDASLSSLLAGGAFGSNLTETVSSMASENNAIFAINGDYYGFRSSGYVMRNGYLYRSTASTDSDQEDLVIYSDGTMKVIRESEVTAEQLQSDGAQQIYSFGPGLVEDGEITVDENSEVERSQNSNPRTAIGMVSEGHYIAVVADGRTSSDAGLSLYELAQVMQDAGCTVAYNLDGGGSSTMVFNGRVVNNPTSFGGKTSERAVSDAICIIDN